MHCAQRPLHDPAPRGPLREAQRKLRSTWKVLSRIRKDTIRDVYLGLFPSSAIAAIGQHGLRGRTSWPFVSISPKHTTIFTYFVPT